MSKGITAERKVAGALREAGYLIASRRHEGGAGDILAIHPAFEQAGFGILLVEVKATKDLPWCGGGFGPSDRYDLIVTAVMHGAIPLLAWLPSGFEWPIFFRRNEWPPNPDPQPSTLPGAEGFFDAAHT